MTKLEVSLIQSLVPVGTLVIGLVWADIREKRRLDREDKRNNAIDSRKREELRHEMQRATMLEAQGALRDLFVVSWDQIHEYHGFPNSRMTVAQTASDLEIRYRDAVDEFTRLTYRILDEDLREELLKFYKHVFFIRNDLLARPMITDPSARLAFLNEEGQKLSLAHQTALDALGKRLRTALDYQ